MTALIDAVRRLKQAGVYTVFIYLQEAHADDYWPLGFGIKSHSNMSDRVAACNRYLQGQKDFARSVDEIVLDTMDDSFLHTFGAWPERYFLADLNGKILWNSNCDNKDLSPSEYFQEVLSML
mmetsp:Transcript_90310/g.188851  ORF Transcript_90310/g.188851 Transcript_90310/m.188851 type:complete len:122 (-) Transcript_90310:266-631(-)